VFKDKIEKKLIKKYINLNKPRLTSRTRDSSHEKGDNLIKKPKQTMKSNSQST